MCIRDRRDITFQNEAGFPVNRVEKISYVRRLLEQAQPQEEWMRQAKDLIDAFLREEYDSDVGADYQDLSRVDVAYTTTSDGEHELQISVNLLHFSLDIYIDERLSASEAYQSLEAVSYTHLLLRLQQSPLCPVVHGSSRDR